MKVLGFFYAGIELYNPAARRAAVEPPWPRGQGFAPLLKYVKDLTLSDTLVNCTYLVCTLSLDGIHFHSHKHIVVMSY
jgi:hypothetical protein